jgi:hypothetical protein
MCRTGVERRDAPAEADQQHHERMPRVVGMAVHHVRPPARQLFSAAGAKLWPLPLFGADPSRDWLAPRHRLDELMVRLFRRIRERRARQ